MILMCFAAAVFLIPAGGCSAKRAPLEAESYQYQDAAAPEASYSRFREAGLEGKAVGDTGGSDLSASGADMGTATAPVVRAVPRGEETLRKLVKRATIRIQVQNLEKADTAISALMEEYGAYASFTNIWGNSRAYTIRVPAASYTVFLSSLTGMGRLIHRSESAEDISLRYYELEGRLATKRELLKTFQSYLGKAKDIEEILSVEERIAVLEDDIDGTGKELRGLANQVDYATITLELQAPDSESPYSSPGLGERISGLLSSFGEFASRVLVILLGIVVYGVPVILILTLLFWVLFGRIGLIKKLWRLAAGKKEAVLKTDNGESP
ncbi:MAG: DUF4349 domain-containing protein [Treponema sp.]|nr:DUF4349 domain-containing protein [Treponema sp.]